MRLKLFMLLMALISLPSLARDFTYNGIVYTVLDETAKTCETKEYGTNSFTGKKHHTVTGDVIIPSVAIDNTTKKEYTVIKIGVSSFAKYEITSITLPTSITSLESNSFSDCVELTSVSLPSSLKRIESGAFEGCSNLLAIDIPDSVQTIGSYAFAECISLSSFDVPQSVEEIGEKTFYGCTNLKTLKINDGDTNIKFGKNAFMQCPIETLYMGRGWDWYYIGESSATESSISTSLKNVTIGERITQIPRFAFSGCTGIKSLEIPPSVKSLANLSGRSLKELIIKDGDDAIDFSLSDLDEYLPVEYIYIGRNWNKTRYNSPAKELKKVVVGKKVSVIPEYAFEKFPKLTCVELPDTLDTIQEWAFHSIGGKPFKVNSPKYIRRIESYAFYLCEGYSNRFIVPPGIEFVGNSAFEFSGFSWVCPDNIEYKSQYGSGPTFYYPADDAVVEGDVLYNKDKDIIRFYAGKEENYVLPKSVREIKQGAFRYATFIKTFELQNNVPPVLDVNSFEGVNPDNISIIIPETAVTNYLSSSWTMFKNIRIGDTGVTIKTFNDGVFNYVVNPSDNTAVITAGNYSSITNLNIPERFTDSSDAANPVRYYIKGIGYNAFKDCYNLTSVQFNNRSSLTHVGDGSFQNCTNLTTISMPSTVEAIGNNAFRSCSKLAEIKLPGALETIGNYAFCGCSITEIDMPDGVKTIGDDAFRLSKLVNITLPKALTTIGERAFSGCKIPSIVIPDRMEKIGAQAFESCPLLSSVTIDGGIVGAHAFESCPLLSSITIGGGVKTIGDNAFASCPKLETVVIPDGVESLGKYSFSKCTGLKTISLGRNVDVVGDGAFQGCSLLDSLSLPASVSTIGESAFYGTGLTSVTIPGNVTSIGKSAFDIGSLAAVKINDAFTPIILGTRAITCTDDFYLGRNVEGSQFLTNTTLGKLTIGNGVKTIPAGAFKNYTFGSLVFGSGITSIGDEAFYGCKLSSLILPPSVEEIGGSAFADNQLSSIVMGYNVESIGEKAFDGSHVKTVAITAPEPPTAYNNTFSDYSGKLYLQGKEAVDKYYDAFTCWDRFDGYAMVEPSTIECDTKEISGKAGETIKLTAKLMPESVTLPDIFWRSTDPEVATVDQNGVVTLLVDIDGADVVSRSGESGVGCKIIAESLYADGPVLEVTVGDGNSGIDDIVTDGGSDGGRVVPNDIYNLQGICLKSNASEDDVRGLAPGLYIIGGKKVSVR